MNQTSRSRLVAFTQLGVGMATFGSATPISKIVTNSMPVFVASLLRVGVGAVVLAPVALFRASEIPKLNRKDWLITGLIALFGMFGFTAFMLYGMKMVSGVVGAIVMSTTPAVTALASMTLMGDKPTWRKLTAVILAVAGVLILHLGQGDGNADETGSNLLWGSLLVFAAVCCEAAYTLLGKVVSERTDPVLVAFLSAVMALPLFLPLAVWQWDGFAIAAVGSRGWAALGWYGAGTLALGTWLWYSGVKKVEGAVAAGFMGVMPTSALVLSYLLLGEAFRWLHLTGFIVVLSGVLLISWEHTRMEQ